MGFLQLQQIPVAVVLPGQRIRFPDLLLHSRKLFFQSLILRFQHFVLEDIVIDLLCLAHHRSRSRPQRGQNALDQNAGNIGVGEVCHHTQYSRDQ